MSGGAFNFFYAKSAEEAIASLEEVRNMVAFLQENKKFDAAQEVERLFLDLRMFRDMIATRLDRLAPLLKDVEWYASGDHGSGSFDEYFQNYEEEI